MLMCVRVDYSTRRRALVAAAALLITPAVATAPVAIADSTDDAFLAKVKAKGIGSDKGDSGLIADARWVCAQYAQGYGIIDVSHAIFANHSDDQKPGFDLYQGADSISGGFISGDNAGYFVFAGHDAYCPKSPGGNKSY
jgi:hypothetical protein